MTDIVNAFKTLYGEDAHNRTRAVVVDDEQLIAKLSSRILRRPSETGIVTTVDFPRADYALAAIDSEETRKNIALIVSDFNMPGINGIEFADSLRKVPDGKIPFLLMSGNIPEIVQKAFDIAVSK